jgi:hypothetical protein
MRTRLALAILVGLTANTGCLVLSVGRFYDEAAIAFDERLVGSWKAVDDNVTVVVERSEWRSYRIQYTHPTEAGVLTGYLFKHGETLYLDLTLIRGKDFGVFVVPGHVLARVTVKSASEIELAPLSYDWFNRGLGQKSLPAALKASRGERDQVVLGGDRAPFWQWLDAAQKSGTAAAIFGAPTVFRKEIADR